MYDMSIANWVTNADECIHTTNVTQLDFTVKKFVQNHDNFCQLLSAQFTLPTLTQRDSVIASAM